jgi:hypothetical protein
MTGRLRDVGVLEVIAAIDETAGAASTWNMADST